MINAADSREARHRMTDALTRYGDLRSPAWRAAFHSVPREVFATTFALRTRDGLRDYTPAAPDYWPAVYSDDSLITLRDAAGAAISSSSQPSLMARMLEALTVDAGDRVLEIGTGTAYNTALLCHRLGGENVTSVDIEPSLTEAARAKLAHLGYQPTLVTGDGLAGHADRGPYDGILATCGVRRVPRAWLQQLRPGGVLVTNIGTGIVRLTADDQGGASGTFLPETAAFMLARPTRDHRKDDVSAYTSLLVHGTGRRTTARVPGDPKQFFTDLILPEALDVALRHSDVLSMTLTKEDGTSLHCLVHPPTESWARVVPDDTGTNVEVTTAGPRDLWAERLELLLPWLHAGRPGPAAYGLTVNAQGDHTLWRGQPDGPAWTF